jgi:hypothetical protein
MVFSIFGQELPCVYNTSRGSRQQESKFYSSIAERCSKGKKGFLAAHELMGSFAHTPVQAMPAPVSITRLGGFSSGLKDLEGQTS